MKMNFILSNTQYHAMQKALAELSTKASENLFEDFIVLVPETKTLLAERCLLDNFQSHAFSNVYIYSFNRLLKKIQSKKVLPLSGQAGVMIVRNLILKNQENLVCYKKTAKTSGFAESVFDTISQLKSSGISPIELSEISEKLPSALKIKIKDIALLYSEYEDYLENRLADPNDRLELLEKESENSEFIKQSHMYIVGFESLTSAMTRVVKGFVKNAKSVTVSASFMHPDRKNAHISDNEVFCALKKVADSLHIKYDSKFFETNLPEDFSFIKNNLFCYPQNSKVNNGAVEIFSAPSLKEESMMVAKKIKKSILSGASRYGEIYCYLADQDAQSYLVQAFDDFQLPYFVSEPYQFENHQFFLFLKSLFALAKRNLEPEEVLKFVRNSLLFLDSQKLDDFENYVLKFGTRYGKFLSPFEYGKDDEKARKNAEEVREAFVKIYYAFLNKINTDLTVNELVFALFAFFEDFEMQTKLEMFEKFQADLGEIRESYATKQVYEKATEVLKMLAQFLGDQKLSLDDFYSLLLSGLEASDISLLPLGVDQIQIVCAPDGIYNAKELYIVGATDGKFPRREQDLGLISDNDIVSLEGINQKKIEPTIRTINRRERFLMFELLQLPLQKLTISFSDHLANGEEAKMSSMVLQLSKLFLQEDESPYEIKKYFSIFEEDALSTIEDFSLSLGSRKNATIYLADAFQKYKNGKDFEAGNFKIGCLYKAITEELDENIKSLFEEINIEKQPEKIDNAKKLYFLKGTTSISELESYFACPFKHFADYGLRLKDRELSDMKALDVGDILHLVCEKFVNFALKRKVTDVQKVSKSILKEVLSLEKYSEEDNKILVKILQEEVVRLCNALLEEMQKSLFKTTNTEEWFGKGGKFEGITICENPKIEIVGKIDRIDQTQPDQNGNGYFRIMDYKTGKIDANAVDIYYGKKLQLAIYLDAVKNKDKTPAGVLYFPIHNEYADQMKNLSNAYKCKGFILNDKHSILKMDTTLTLESPKSKFIFPEVKTNKENLSTGEIEFKSNESLISAEEMQSISSYAKKLASKAVKEILDGFIKPTPLKSSDGLSCKYCAYKNICGIVKNQDKWVREQDVQKVKDFYKGGKKWDL